MVFNFGKLFLIPSCCGVNISAMNAKPKKLRWYVF